MGIKFDSPEKKVKMKRRIGDRPNCVWQNRLYGTVYDVWTNDHNNSIPGKSFTYPEFKGNFRKCKLNESENNKR